MHGTTRGNTGASVSLDGPHRARRLPGRGDAGGVTRYDTNRRMLRARDAIDRCSDQPLDVTELARIAVSSEAHFIRTFRATFGETPHRYLQRRRIERAMTLLRSSERSVTDICMEVGFTSLSTFTRTFRSIVGEPPSEFRRHGALPAVPTCFVKTWTRPSSFGTAPSTTDP